MKTLQEYLALPYTMIVRWNANDELFVARIQEIPGCTGHGESESEALTMVRENLGEWIAYCLETGEDIPVPLDAESLPSGKWLQRVPRSLHKRLIECADADNVSLNAYVTACLARCVGEFEAHASDQSPAKIALNITAASTEPQYLLQQEAWQNLKALDLTMMRIYNSWCRTEIVQKGAGITAAFVKTENPQYSEFVNRVADQLPTHLIKKSARTSREEKDNYKKFAYA